MAELLLKHGADPAFGRPSARDREIIAQITGTSDPGAIFAAIEDGDLEYVEYYLKRGVDRTITVEKSASKLPYANGSTPLHVALSKFGTTSDDENRQAIVDRLVKYGFDINARDTEGKTPLQRVIYNRNKKAVLAVLPYKPNVNVRDQRGRTPLHYAAERDEIATVSALLDAGADPTIADNAGKTAIDEAQARKNRQLIQVLTVRPMPE
jgi:ankyrin repeat protein